MPRTLEEAEDDGDRKLIGNVAAGHWHVVTVLEDDEGPGFAFTIGIFTNFGHPELMIVGLRREVMHRVLNDLGEQVRGGARFAPADAIADALEGVTCTFVEVDRKHYRDWLGYARWWYRGDEFPALQLIYPDMKNRMPWDAGANPRLATQQPILGAVAAQPKRRDDTTIH
jgi:hypothetical protein